MGGIAQIAKAMGHEVTGSDKAIYPPMSTQLEAAKIGVLDDESVLFLNDPPDDVVIGNAKSRGHMAVEATLNAQQSYTSGPQWLAEHVLKDRWVIAVAGTHGKTSTASMVAWVLEFAGLKPGFLIGGVPENFGVSARLGHSPFFVVEADEYDTAFFDKRSKFVHYHPRTCVLNNLEFDHADIFDSIKDIQRQFHHLIRTVPGNGLIVMPNDDAHLDEVIVQGCWSPIEKQGEAAELTYQLISEDGTRFDVIRQGDSIGQVDWGLTGEHNIRNALSAISASIHCGVPPKMAVEALCSFNGIRRRMTLIGEANYIRIYDDFAHHPTAIATTLKGAKQRLTSDSPSGRLIAVFEPRSNTMRMGVHKQRLPQAFEAADSVYAFIDEDWNWQLSSEGFSQALHVDNSYQTLLDRLVADLQPQDTVVIMSNGSFGGLHHQLLERLLS